MVNRKTVAAVGAAGILVFSGFSAYTAQNDTLTINTPSAEEVDYLTMVPTTATTTAPLASLTTDSGVTITPVYGHQPEWSRIADGTSAVPAEIQEAGDVAYIDASALDSTDAGDVLGALAIEGVITNAAEIAADYSSCQLPMKVRVTDDNGSTWNDVTNTFFDVAAGEPHYVDCVDSQFDFVISEGDLDKIFALSVEQGGAMMPRNHVATFASPAIAMFSTPVGALSSVDLVRAASDCAAGFTFTNNQCEGTFAAGSSYSFTVPSGINSVTFTLAGASGGTGGNDGSSPGGDGSVGGQVSGTLAVGGGDTLSFAAGTAGGNGVDSAPSGDNNAVGAAGTNALDASYNGGIGALAGPSGSSGSGGGGGAASVLRWTDASTSATTDIVAAGGGGGGGAGGTAGLGATTTFIGYDPNQTIGQDGTRHPGDGGSGGGGGGGAEGGAGGGISGDIGLGGSIGLNATADIGGLSEGLAGSTGNGTITITY